MNFQDLSTLGASFTNEAQGSQIVFRAALNALSNPGTISMIVHDATLPSKGHSSSAAWMLAMLDADCRLWLSPTLAQSNASEWLHFHTGCRIVEDVSTAQFLWVAAQDALPSLSGLAQGSDTYPDQSATCLVDVVEVNSNSNETNNQSWILRGPGIQNETTLSVLGLPADFLVQWATNHARFPRGVDIFLATPEHLVGLPRSTRISQAKGK
jgi:alpha-D-ribose 1-methylphosphonate 5-triphosphate synthase subunit PhnH